MSVMGIYATIVLKRKIDEVIARPEYQPGVPRWDGTPATWCNEAANAILVELGFETKPILEPKGIKWTGATAMYNNAAKVATVGGACVFETSPRQAQAMANIGIPVLAAAKNSDPKKSSHVGIVYPTDDKWNPRKGPLIGQAGAKQTHGIRSAYDSFVKWKLSEPRYFIMPRRIT